MRQQCEVSQQNGDHPVCVTVETDRSVRLLPALPDVASEAV